jgi:hypothetical protein
MAWERVWLTIDKIGDAVLQKTKVQQLHKAPTELVHCKPFTQESLVAFVDVIRSTRAISRMLDDVEWPIERLTRLLAILKGHRNVFIYSRNTDLQNKVF